MASRVIKSSGDIPNSADAASNRRQSTPAQPQPAGEPKADSPRNNPRGPDPASHDFKTIRDALIPAQLQLASGALLKIDGAAFKSYRDTLVREAKAQDVLEQTLLEQVALAHLASFRLLGLAGIGGTAEAEGIYGSTAAKLMGEVRRTIVAIKELRSPPSAPSISISATQQVNVTGNAVAESSAEAAEKSGTRSELGSNNATGPNRMREILGEDIGRTPQSAVARAVD
jgi:hypothetical protein